MPDDLMEAMTKPCQGPESCTTPDDQVAWCPSWDCWLCHGCRWRRNDRELRTPREPAERKLMRKAGIG